jgi:hypothetical protein
MDDPSFEIGINLPWPGKFYGYWIGPHRWRDDAPINNEINRNGPFWGKTLSKDFQMLSRDYNIRLVRLFLFATAVNVDPPVALNPSAKNYRAPWVPAEQQSPLFVQHFRTLLQLASENGIRLMPVLFDFGLAYSARRTLLDVYRQNVWKIFTKALLIPYLEECKRFRDTIYAWDVINEPYWCQAPIRPEVHYYIFKTAVPVINDYPLVTRKSLNSAIKFYASVIKDAGF